MASAEVKRVAVRLACFESGLVARPKMGRDCVKAFAAQRRTRKLVQHPPSFGTHD